MRLRNWITCCLVLALYTTTAIAQKNQPQASSPFVKQYRNDKVMLATWGTCIYHVSEGRDLPCEWVGYLRSSNRFEIEINTRIYGFDLQPIRKLKDRHGHRYQTAVWRQDEWTSWIGLDHDWSINPLVPCCKMHTPFHDKELPNAVRNYLTKLSEAQPRLTFEIVGTPKYR